MRANPWSLVVIALSLFSLTVQASPPDVQEPGTRVSIRLAESSGELPDAEKMVESLATVGGKHQVRALRHHSSGQQELTLELWGGTVPQNDIPQTLRDAFPVLSSADIQVATIDPKDRPKFEGGEKGKVKKIVKIIKKE